ncbi:hypothetical protein LTR37_008137 [Vermiconidia calcicola]|uniref:Uncharacterized protein n=1 Tax=Vermiconidia calcicola TaxID=1690605 RepID=A0ACC3NBL4_9PEZI|nr:hypothetical protein LTR37_008137 [Vermiconidia calcicola]
MSERRPAFLRLPAELRNHIYGVVADESSRLDVSRFEPYCLPSLLGVNRQIREEFIPIYYSIHILQFGIFGGYALQDLARWLCTFGSQALPWITRFSFRVGNNKYCRDVSECLIVLDSSRLNPKLAGEGLQNSDFSSPSTAHEEDSDSQTRLAHDLRYLARADIRSSTTLFYTSEVRGTGFRAYTPTILHWSDEDICLLEPLGAYLEAVLKGKEEVSLSVEEFEDLVFMIGKWKGGSMTGFAYSNPVTDVDVSAFWEMARCRVCGAVEQ